MRLGLIAFVLAASSLAHAGQPIVRFWGADHMTFSQGSADPRFGNADADVQVSMNVFILGNQTFSGTSTSPEARFNKSAGSLNFTLRLSDFDPTLPPDLVTMVGQDTGNDTMRHTTNSVLPGPYHMAGSYNGVAFDITVSNVQVTGLINSQCSNNVVAPSVNPVLGEFCDVQFDDIVGSNNTITAIPGQVSGWVVAPTFTVRSMRIDVNGIQQAGQVPAHIVRPSSTNVQLGRVDAGSTTSLGDADGDAFRICKFIVPNQQVAPVTVELFSNVTTTPQYLSLIASSRMTVTGVFQQTLELYDRNGGYAAGDTRTDPMSTTYTNRQLDATGNVVRYLGQNEQVRARYLVRQTGPASSSSWCAEHDWAAWIVTP